jgi:hypothetical protein
MLRRTAVVLALAAMVLVPAPAALGGGSTFDFGRYHVPGERVVGVTEFWIRAKDRQLLERAFYAYLIPSRSWIEPPDIPAEAVFLGPVTIAASEGGGVARMSFIVPDVAPGGYNVALCDLPCRHAFLGDLVGGWITVVGSQEEVRLRRMIDRLENRVWRVESNLERRLQNGNQRMATLQNQVNDLTAQLERHRTVLESALAGMGQKPAAETSAFDGPAG